MRVDRFGLSRLVALVVLSLAFSASALCQDQNPTSQSRKAGVTQSGPMISNGQKAKIKGIITRRDADTFTVADDATGAETVVMLTDRSSVRSKGGFLRSGKDYDVTSLLRGLRVEVEGRGNPNGQLVADKIRFDSADLKYAKVVDSRVAPVEEANRHLAGQIEESTEIAKNAGEEAHSAHERISALDDYDVEDSVTVFFPVNSTTISANDKAALDQLAEKAMTTKGYVIEVAGYTDSTGSIARNRQLSQQRADAVVRYLQEHHEIPLRRMITPFGYGEMRPVADNGSVDGRRQNRRVEVKILVSKGIAGSNS